MFAAQKFHDAIPLLDEILLIDSTLTEAQTLHQQCLAKTNTIVSAPGFSQNNAGTTISRYRIITRLGAGGMGVIYKAEDTRLKRLVVLKFLSPHLTADAIAKERFIREAQAASALDHPNICTIYEIDETTRSPNLQFEEGAGQLFICMAYYEGQTLKEKLTSGGFPLDTATSLAIQIAEGLAKAHENGIVHRDIKPANIMITKNGLVKILDFGLAKLTGETRLTRSGMTAGTLGYLSPEQAQNREVDHRSDIWSLGVMLYQMTTGKLPFDGDYELAVLYAIVNNNPIPALQLNSNIPVELEQVINRTLQKSVEARFASMQEMLEELKHVQRRYYRKEEHEVGALSGEVGSLIAKGKFLLEKKEYPEALSRFKAALALDAKNQEVAEFIAVCERKQKEAQQIAKWLDTVKKQFEKGAYQSSLTTIQTVLMLEPDHAEAKNWEKKIKEYLVQSETVEKLFSDAEFYLRKEKFPQAREAYQEILKLEPVNKNATRGLERAEKSLQSRKLEAGPSQVTQLGQIDQPRALPVAKSKSLSKGLWVGLAGLVVVAAASAWFLWLRPDLQTPSEPSKPSLDFSQRAAAAKQEMLLAKAQAQQADAQRWASNTYQRAAQSELSGEQEAAQGIWGSASQAYEAATKLFKEATKEATNNAAVADLDMLKNRIKQVQQDMLREKMLAEKAGAPTKTKMLFEQTVRKEQEGNREFDVHQRSNYLNAQKLYGEARDEYRQIKQEALRLTQAAEAARQALLTAKNKIPGDNTAKSSSGYYAKAETTANLGMRQLLKGDYSTAITSFQQAQQLYTTAESELGKTALKGSVDTTKASMLEARGKVDKTLRSDAKYLNAEQSRTEGNNALMAEDFAEAIARYSAAKDLYVTVVNESNERLSRRADQEATAQREIQALIDRYKMGLEQRDLQALKTILGKTFMKDDEGAWTSFFKRAREIKPKIESNFEFIGNNAKIYLKIHLDFFNITNNEDSQSEFAESWLLEQMNGSWTIVERTRR
ncbi:MAG: protein kinase domain-containing protein [bacterium]